MNFSHGYAIKGNVNPTYTVWVQMKARCLNPNSINFERYGGRGITVCQAWLDNFETFLQDMGERPESMTLERKDNSLGYSPENCKWATLQEQALNKRTYSSNKSGRKGVNWKASRQKWEASGTFNGHQKHLYQGDSFEAACAARQAWEDSTGYTHGS